MKWPTRPAILAIFARTFTSFGNCAITNETFPELNLANTWLYLKFTRLARRTPHHWGITSYAHGTLTGLHITGPRGCYSSQIEQIPSHKLGIKNIINWWIDMRLIYLHQKLIICYLLERQLCFLIHLKRICDIESWKK